MKFLCDNCKAKYQIADDRVAGRTVRMKCRKCGHLIEIRSSVTETSAAISLSALMQTEQSLQEMRKRESAAPPPPEEADEPKAATPAPRPAAAPRAGAPKPAVGAPKPAGGAPKPAATAPKPAARPTADKAPAPRAGARGASTGPASMRGGLAGAFQASVADDPPSTAEEPPASVHGLDLSSPSSVEEWYVGINSVPVGPIRLSELREKAQAGLVTEESLCWREGFEEWLPLRSLPELAESIRAANERPSFAPPKATGRSTSSLSSGTGPRSSRSGPSSSRSGQTAAVVSSLVGDASARSNVIPLHNRAATAEKLEEAPLADPFAAPAPEPAALADPFAPNVPGSVGAPHTPGPAAVPVIAVAAAPTNTSVFPEERERRRSGGIPVAAWVAIVAAMGLGVAAGSILFSKAPPPPTVQIVTVTATPTAGPAPTTTTTATDTTATPDPTTTAPVKVATGPKATGGPAIAAAPDKTAEPAVPTIGAIGAVPQIGGPSTGNGPGNTAAGGSTEKLTGDQVSQVVNSGKNALKRACWEPALAARPANGPSSARVSIAMSIGPDGRVQSAVPSGGDGFPGLATCIGSRVRSWQFPQSGSVTQVSPSFSFVAQLGSLRYDAPVGERQTIAGGPLVRGPREESPSSVGQRAG